MSNGETGPGGPGGPGGDPLCKNLRIQVQDCATSKGLLLFNVTRVSTGAFLACDATSNCLGSNFIVFCAIDGEKLKIGATGYQLKEVTITQAMITAGSTIVCLDAKPAPPPPKCLTAAEVFGAEDSVTRTLDLITAAAFSYVDPGALGPLEDAELPTRVAEVVSRDPQLFVRATAAASSVAMFVRESLDASCACGARHAGLSEGMAPRLPRDLGDRLASLFRQVADRDEGLREAMDMLGRLTEAATGQPIGHFLLSLPELLREISEGRPR
jgi:hypothetical protein